VDGKSLIRKRPRKISLECLNRVFLAGDDPLEHVAIEMIPIPLASLITGRWRKWL